MDSKHLEAAIDEWTVDRFAEAMKAKLAQKRAEGRGGWWHPEACSDRGLLLMLRDHVERGDMADVANLAMFIWGRGSRG